MTVPKNQKPIHVSGLEVSILRDYAKTSPLVLIRQKAQAVLLFFGGADLSSISYAMDRTEATVYGWISNWRECRLASIFTRHAGNNNAGKLSPEQRGEIQQALQSPPSDFGLPKTFWDVPQLKNYLEATWEVAYESLNSYYLLLRFSGLDLKYPSTFDRRRDEAHIQERMAAIRKELAPLLASPDWEVFSADEVRLEQEAIIRRAWLQKGKPTVIKVDRQRQAQSYLGFLNQKTGQCHTYELPWQNSEEVIKSTEQFLREYPGKKMAIVWDNAAFHKSKALREELKTGGALERVHLIAMPPYAPDENPIEHVWKEAKQHIANFQQATFEQTKGAFISFITSRKFEYFY